MEKRKDGLWRIIVFMIMAVISIILYISYKQYDVERIQNKKIMKVACVGDSITFRFGFENEPEYNYPVVLAELLGDGYEVKNFGVPGACIQPEGDKPYTMFEVYQDVIDYSADILVFMIGTNDSKMENWNGKEAFYYAYINWLDEYLQYHPDVKVYICTSPKAFSVMKEQEEIEFEVQPMIIEEIAAVQRQIAEERGYRVIDIYKMSEMRQEWFAEDGIHPTLEGARGLAEIIAEALKE